MRKYSVAATALLMGFAGVVWACDKEARIAKYDCAQAKKAAIAKVMETLPSMAYRVGDLDTHCIQSATAKAGENGKIQFVVSGKSYDNETEAVLVLAKLLEKASEDLKTVSFAVGDKKFGCPVSAKAACKKDQKVSYRLAGFDFASSELAEKALKRVNCALSGCKGPCGDYSKADYAKTVAASAKLSPCSGKGAVTTVASAKPDCNKNKATTAGLKSDAPCNKGAAKTVAASDKGKGCPKARAAALAKTVAAESKGGCCSKAKARMASAQDTVRLIVETVASAAQTS